MVVIRELLGSVRRIAAGHVFVPAQTETSYDRAIVRNQVPDSRHVR